MAQTKLESYRDPESVRQHALHGGDDPPDYGAEATRRRATHGGDGRRPTWLLDDDERQRRIVEGDHPGVA